MSENLGEGARINRWPQGENPPLPPTAPGESVLLPNTELVPPAPEAATSEGETLLNREERVSIETDSETQPVPPPFLTIQAIEAADHIIGRIVKKTGAPGSFNVTKVLVADRQTLGEITDLIRNAQEVVDIHMFSWGDDEVGGEVAQALIDLVEEGGERVKTRATVDRIGTFAVGSLVHMSIPGKIWFGIKKLPRFLLECFRLRVGPKTISQGVKMLFSNVREFYRMKYTKQKATSTLISRLISEKTVLAYNPWLCMLRRKGVDLVITKNDLGTMDHGKTIRVDNTVICGGANFGLDYFGTSGKKGWRDYIIVLTGEAAEDISRQMNFEPDVDPSEREHRTRESDEQVPVWCLRNYAAEDGTQMGAERFQVTSAIITLINEAKSSVKFEHAYLMSMLVINAIMRALKRGVQVTMLRSQPEMPNIESANEEYFQILETMAAPYIASGQLQIWQSDEVLHTKLMVVDDKYILVGSANLTTESLKYNREQALLFYREDSQPEDSAPQVLKRRMDERIAAAKEAMAA